MSLIVVQPGPLTTIQDRGRAGQRRWGVPASGALDPAALAAANLLAGNPPDTACLEITGVGCQIDLAAPALIAVAGADLGGWIDELPLPLWHACFTRPGQTLRWTRRVSGGRCYLAVQGGLNVPSSLGSSSALIGGPFPGLLGRALRPGDRIGFRRQEPDLRSAGAHWPPQLRPAYVAEPTIRILPGPQQPLIADQWERLLGQEWRISPASNRMGCRLLGEPLTLAEPISIPSCGVVPGAIQIPPDGLPVALLADAQTTGGYPLVAAVISADLPLFAHMLPGDRLRFAETTLAIARGALRRQREGSAKPIDCSQQWGAPC